jgi:rod shape-determining protein MreD
LIITYRIVARIAAIAVAAVLVQIAGLSQLTMLGTQPDVIPVVVVSIGILAGSLPGAVVGFGTGVLMDTALLQPLGVSSLILLGVGYLAGRYRELYDISNAFTPLLLAGGLTMLAVSGFAILQLLLGVEAPVSPLIIRDVLVKSLLNLIFAIPIYVGIRRVLRVALIEETAPRRRARRPTPVGAA